MEIALAKKTVMANVELYKRILGLGQWHLDIYYRRLPEGQRGECHTQPDYMRAQISIDNDQIDDEEALLRLLRHELIHVFLWPATKLASAMEDLTDDNKMADDLRHQLWTFIVERQVKEIEMLLDRTEAMVPPAKRKTAKKRRR